MRPITLIGTIIVLVVAGVIAVSLSGIIAPANPPAATATPVPTPAPTPLPVFRPTFVPTPNPDDQLSYSASLPTPTPSPTPEPPTEIPDTPTPGPTGLLAVTTNVTDSNDAGITLYDQNYWSLPVASMWGYLDFNFTLPYGNYVVIVEDTWHRIVSSTNVTVDRPSVTVTVPG